MSATRRKRILVVDDDEHQLIVIGDCLRFEGFDVVTARGGEEALRILQKERPNLVLLDVMMPGLDGGGVAQAIRGDPRLAQVPIVFLTAVVSKDEARDHYGIIGGEPFVAKPVALEELVQVIRKHVAE